ncbi:hypothetical protein L838_5370 [Mycobacterium avium MAV_120709_2344]|uniref:Uncharacterized protein n=1 Tax=Mycobacterium avium (strain 104) TaxID=243243 RepID=A0A0H2ZWC0_MYCA1|nr:hypothetical protein MAV_3023 [Mycobacterium avium 104]ETZ41089.1 hypothetical protein L838_5370 [Mycobacterium avium MAV_120709_2344]ETZ59579.1 hypothetical protein L840_2406 [Mycobacterium sp. MAC_011194_8550]ETZ72481.1 hypothetical protein L841_0671 [Mycobacterium sp. MAC_080597_8934]
MSLAARVTPRRRNHPGTRRGVTRANVAPGRVLCDNEHSGVVGRYS